MQHEQLLLEEIANQPYPLLFVTVSGAHLYGFPSDDSDYDLRGVHILPLEEVVGLGRPRSTIDLGYEREGVIFDIVTHDAYKYFRQLADKQDGNMLEQIFSPLVMHTTPEHEELQDLARGCITRGHARHYLGFARSQWRLFASESPPRVKPLLYVFRVLLTGIHLMQTGEVEANLLTLNEQFNLTFVPDLVAQKHDQGEKAALEEVDIDFFESEYRRVYDVLETAYEASELPLKPRSTVALNALLLRVRGI